MSLKICLIIWWSLIMTAAMSSSDNNIGLLKKLVSDTNSLQNQATVLMRRPKVKRRSTTTTTTTAMPEPEMNDHFDTHYYRSSWRFIDKHTIRVRFNLYGSLLRSSSSRRFLVRHARTGHVRRYDRPSEMINSTLILDLHELEHGKHTVCLMIYALSNNVQSLTHTFCQDIVFNFHKYGHLDADSDTHGNQFFFLLVQYAIVFGILCILQIVHIIRKRRIMKAISHKASALRHAMSEYHHHHHHHSHETKPTLDPETSTIISKLIREHVFFDLDKSDLRNQDRLDREITNEEDNIRSDPASLLMVPSFQQTLSNLRRSSLPNRSNPYSTTQLPRRMSVRTGIFDVNEDDDDSVDGSVFGVREYEEQPIRLTSSTHLAANKPLTARVAKDGSVQHVIRSDDEV